MYHGDENIPESEVTGIARQMTKPTIRQQLETEQATLTDRLSLVKIALGELDAHPEVASVLETISKIRGFNY